MIGGIRKAIGNPWLIPLMVSHRYHRWTGGTNSSSVMEEDWDNLIILDACRFDLFESCWDGPGELTSVTSMGSNTPEWLNRTFTETYPDTVYVTGNPQLEANNIDDKFHDFVSVWRTDWDDEKNTVLPESMVERTIESASTYPHKRIISHWIQPHYPFVGQTGADIDQGTLTGGGVREGSMDAETIWDKLESGELDRETVWRAYKENLEIALPHVHRLIESLEGRTVVTSDHGNVFGRLGLYGHPGQKYIEELVKVPWLVIEGDRKEIQSGDLKDSRNVGEGVEERLRDLGYK